jgi:ribosomal protein S13
MKETFPNNSETTDLGKGVGLKERLKSLLATGVLSLSTLLGSPEMKAESNSFPAFETLKLISESETGREHRDKFTIQVLEPNSERFLMQIGQFHYRPDIENSRPEMTTVIINSQKEVEKALENIAKINSSSTNVFVEGYTIYQEQYMSEIRELMKNVENLSNENDSNTKIEGAIRAYAEKLDRPISSYETVTFGYIAQKFKDRQSGGTHTNQGKGNPLEKFISECNTLYGTPDSIYLVSGGAYKAFIDGKINIIPCEGANYLNQENHDELDKDESIRAAIAKTDDPEELRKLNAQLSQIDRSKIEALTGDERENQTLEIVLKNSNGQKIIPLVFGFDHDFSNNIKELNTSSPGQSINLARYNAQ